MRMLLAITRLRRLTTPDVARRNAATAAAALSAARREREDVEAYLDQHLVRRSQRPAVVSA